MSRSSKKKNLKSCRKRPSVRDEQKSILILTEGERTEEQYFNELIQELGVGAWVEVIEKVKSAPIKIAEKAQAFIEEKEDYEIIYCVFDKDIHSDYDRALELINNINGMDSVEVHAISSVPCFEFWLYLHWSYSDGSYSSARELIRKLKKIPEFKDYDKSIQGALFEYLFIRRHTARDNAIRVLRSARGHQNKPKLHYQNPSTQVHIVLKMLEHYASMKPA